MIPVGLPATIWKGGLSLLTALPAPMVDSLPIFTTGKSRCDGNEADINDGAMMVQLCNGTIEIDSNIGSSREIWSHTECGLGYHLERVASCLGSGYWGDIGDISPLTSRQNSTCLRRFESRALLRRWQAFSQRVRSPASS